MPVTQEGFRWRNDDGDEDGATWAAAQDAHVTVDRGDTARLRVLLDADDDPDPAAYTLYYKKTGDSTWLPVPVGASGGISAVRFDDDVNAYYRDGTGLGSTAITMACWIYLSVDSNDYIAMLTAYTDSSNYVQIGTAVNGTTLTWWDGAAGIGIATGPDMTVGAWYYVAVVYDPSGADTLYHALEGSASLTAVSAITPAGGLSGTITFQVAHDAFGSLFNGRLAQVKVWSAALSKSELEAEMYADELVRTSNAWAYYSFRAGPQTNDESGNTRTLTASGTVNTESGPPLNPVYIAPSANITAGGEATTAQLTAPAGKTTADFSVGRMWDDENGTDSVDI